MFDVMQTHRSKLYALFFLALALVALLILAVGLTGLELKGGEPFPLDMNFSFGSPGGAVPGGDLLVQIFRIFYTIMMILFPISLIYALLDAQSRKKLLRFVIFMIPVMLLAYWLFNWIRNMKGDQQRDFPLGFLQAPETGESAQPSADFTPTPSQGLILGLSLALAFIVLVLIGLILWQIWRRTRSRPGTLQMLAQQAQVALDEMQAGADLRNTIIRCYKEMSLVVEEQKGVRRGYTMTSHEFESLLVGQGLPRQPVHQLTQLFEDVRYGDKEVGQREEMLARDSLSAIIQVCRSSPS